MILPSDSLQVAAIVNRVLADHWTLGAAIMSLIIILFFVWAFVKVVLVESGEASRRVFDLVKYLYREVVGGPDVMPYERLNGITVVGLFGLVVICILLIAVHGVRDLVAGDKMPGSLVAALLGLTCLFVITGVSCSRFCARHKDEMLVARAHRSNE